MTTKAPVGLEQGDLFETEWNNLEVMWVDVNEYGMRDTVTDEEFVCDHGFLVEVMEGTVTDKPYN